MPDPAVPVEETRGHAGASESGSQDISLTAFGLSLAGVLFGLLTLIPAFVLGILALQREPAGRSYAKAALWLSSILMVICLLKLVLIVVFVTLRLQHPFPANP